MRKPFALVLLCASLSIALLFTINLIDLKTPETRSQAQGLARSNDAAENNGFQPMKAQVVPPDTMDVPPDEIPEPAPEDVLTPIPNGPHDVLTVIAEDAADAFPFPPNAVVQTAPEFAKGKMENIVLGRGLSLKRIDATGGEAVSWGTFESVEVETQEPFNAITVSYEGSRSEDSEMSLEYRVRNSNGWSDWHETSLDFPPDAQLDVPATAWQYRVTMVAMGAVESPRVDRVVVVAQNASQSP